MSVDSVNRSGNRDGIHAELVAMAVMYLWLAVFPLKAGAAWAWWALLVSGVVGFGRFLTYLGYGYVDTWHGSATLVLLPCFVVGASPDARHATSRCPFSRGGNITVAEIPTDGG